MGYRVLIVDDEKMHRELFSMIVENSSEYTLVGNLISASMAADFCKCNAVDLVIMDVVMKDGSNGIDAAKAVKDINKSIKIMIVTSMPEASFIRKAREIGVESFWYKEIEQAPLLDVINRTMNGESVYPDSVPTVELGLAKNTDFTQRELDVLRELVAGGNNQEIADNLNMSVNTVRFHLSSLLSKTGCSSRVDLAIKAAKSGIIVANIK